MKGVSPGVSADGLPYFPDCLSLVSGGHFRFIQKSMTVFLNDVVHFVVFHFSSPSNLSLIDKTIPVLLKTMLQNSLASSRALKYNGSM